MSLNKFTDADTIKEWMNVGCNIVNCNNLTSQNFTTEDINCENLTAEFNVTCALLNSGNISTEDLNVKINPTDTINFKTPNLGLIGDVLATDGLGHTFWTSNPSPPPTGITYNGIIPTPYGALLKTSNGIGTTADNSSIIDDGTNINITTTNLKWNTNTIATLNDLNPFNQSLNTFNDVSFNNAESPNLFRSPVMKCQTITTYDGNPFESINIGDSGYKTNINTLLGVYANNYVKNGATSNDILTGDGTTIPQSTFYSPIVSTNLLLANGSNISQSTFYSPIVSNNLLLANGSNISQSTFITPSPTFNLLLGDGTTIPQSTFYKPIVSTNLLLADGTNIPQSTFSSVRQGFEFNPSVNNTAYAPTGSKAYIYQVLVPENLFINGFKVYVNTGSDNMRVGIYRGFVKASPASSAVLVGQSAVITPSTSLPYTSAPIVAVGIQNLNFSQNEYMCIAFHSSGITNQYLHSVTAVANFDLAFNANFNGASGSFTTPLTSTNQSATILSNICFTLY